MVCAFRGITADADAAGQGQAEQGIGHPVFSDQVQRRLPQSFLPEGNVDPEKIGAITESLPVLLPAERGAVEDADGIEQAVPEQKAPVENGYDRVFFRNPFAVKENEHPLLVAYP